jgi:hypothetical protein
MSIPHLSEIFDFVKIDDIKVVPYKRDSFLNPIKDLCSESDSCDTSSEARGSIKTEKSKENYLEQIIDVYILSTTSEDFHLAFPDLTVEEFNNFLKIIYETKGSPFEEFEKSIIRQSLCLDRLFFLDNFKYALIIINNYCDKLEYPEHVLKKLYESHESKELINLLEAQMNKIKKCIKYGFGNSKYNVNHIQLQ